VFADLDETIRHLLIEHVPLDTSRVDVSFEAPDREWSGRLTRPTVNSFLYDVRENLEFRERDFDVSRDHANGTVSRKPRPLRMNATYNVTVWARAPEDEHGLLWRVLAALTRYTTLPDEAAQGALQEQPYPMPARVAQPDQWRASPADLWQALDNRIRPSLSYVVTVALDPSQVVTSPMVFTSTIGVRPMDGDDQSAEHLVQIGGRIRDRKDRTQFVSGATVHLRETGARVTSDARGRFKIRRVPHGKITLAVEAPGHKAVSLSTVVPSPTYDVEV